MISDTVGRRKVAFGVRAFDVINVFVGELTCGWVAAVEGGAASSGRF